MYLLKAIAHSLEGNFQTIEKTLHSSQDWRDILRKASQNRVLYAFCHNLIKERGHLLHHKLEENLRRIMAWGDLWQSKLHRTLLFIDSLLSENGIPYLVVKTYRSIPYVTYDVDVLVKPSDYDALESKLKRVGELGKHPGKQARKQVNFFAPDLLTIDVHKDFSWQGSSYLDESIVWANTRKQDIAGIFCPIPSADVEFLLEAAHVLFERRYITLLDFIFMYRMCREGLNQHLLLEQVEAHGWDESFISLVEIVSAINSIFHDDEYNFLSHNYHSNFQFNTDEFDMPYFLSPLFVSKVFGEKLRKKGYFPKWDYLYYLFTVTRYYITRKKRFPYYVEWAPLDELTWE